MEIRTKEVLRLGWTKTKENLWFIIAFELLAFAVTGAGMHIFGDESLFGFIVSTLVGFVFTSVFLRISRGEKIDFNNIFVGFSGNKFFHYLLATIVVGLFVIAGIILLVVPGVIVALATCFASYVIIDMDKNVPVVGRSFWVAIKESYQMTKGMKWRLFGFFLVLFGINILGAIALIVGLLVTIPVSMIALAAVYNKLKARVVEPTVVVAEPVSNSTESQPSTIS
jgi:uncharacterized membrane protein